MVSIDKYGTVTFEQLIQLLPPLPSSLHSQRLGPCHKES